jgi:hypothetical protein
LFWRLIEDGDRIHHLHSAIENAKPVTLYDACDVPDDLPEPLLAATATRPGPTVH